MLSAQDSITDLLSAQLEAGILKTVGPAVAKAVKAEAPDAGEQPDDDVDAGLQDYAGDFGGSVWGGETAVRVWGDELAVVGLPTDELEEIVKLKRTDGDTFLRVTDDGDERESWRFERDQAGRVIAYWRHSMRIPRI